MIRKEEGVLGRARKRVVNFRAKVGRNRAFKLIGPFAAIVILASGFAMQRFSKNMIVASYTALTNSELFYYNTDATNVSSENTNRAYEPISKEWEAADSEIWTFQAMNDHLEKEYDQTQTENATSNQEMQEVGQEITNTQYTELYYHGDNLKKRLEGELITAKSEFDMKKSKFKRCSEYVKRLEQQLRITNDEILSMENQLKEGFKGDGDKMVQLQIEINQMKTRRATDLLIEINRHKQEKDSLQQECNEAGDIVAGLEAEIKKANYCN